MRGSKTLLAVVTLVATVAVPALASAAPRTGGSSTASGMPIYGSIQGKITAVDLKAKSIKVAATEGSLTGPVNVTFTDRTIVHQGLLQKKAADIKVGEYVDMTYAGSGDNWVADNIDIVESSVALAPYLGNDMR